MRIIFFILLSCSLAYPASMTVLSGSPPAAAGGAITEVASMKATNTTGSGDSATLAFPTNVTSGQMLVVGGAAWSSTQPTAVAVTDTRGTSYTVVTRAEAALNWAIFIAYGVASSSGANTVTVNPNGAASADMTFSIDAFTGLTQVDVAPAGMTSDNSAVVAYNLTTVAANTLALGIMSQDGSTQTLAPGATFSQIGESENNSTNQCHSFIFKILSSAGLTNIPWSVGGSMPWSTYGLSLKP